MHCLLASNKLLSLPLPFTAQRSSAAVGNYASD